MSLTTQHGTGHANVDHLANEIFALLNDTNRKESIKDVQLRLAQAASMLVRPTVASEPAIHVALQGLRQDQLEVLFPHLGGMTCAQIAARLGKSEQSVFEELTSTYVQLRYSLGREKPSGGQTFAD